LPGDGDPIPVCDDGKDSQKAGHRSAPPLLVANRLILCLADDKDAERRIDSNRIAGSIVFHAPQRDLTGINLYG